MCRPCLLCVFFFFKKKTAYEMRISDWSSDVCSSDLVGIDRAARRIRLDPVVDDEHEIFPAREVSYDTLVLAVGSRSNFFGTPGAREYAVALDSTQDRKSVV